MHYLRMCCSFDRCTIRALYHPRDESDGTSVYLIATNAIEKTKISRARLMCSLLASLRTRKLGHRLAIPDLQSPQLAQKQQPPLPTPLNPFSLPPTTPPPLPH